jgi:ATP-binding cassette subfamily C protein CydC
MNERKLINELLASAGAGTNRLRMAVACAILASLAAIALLGISGWFLTQAAIAGAAGAAAVQAFNYLIPSAGIRLLAIVRTAARYGERLLGHQAALQAMADLRTRLFSRRSAEDSRGRSSDPRTASATLLDDIAALEDIVMRRPAWFAGLAGCAVSIAFVSATGLAAAIGQALLLTAIPFLVRWLTARFTDEPARMATSQAVAMRSQFTEFAASRSEIASYGLAQRVTDEMAPLWDRFEESKEQLLKGEALITGLLGAYMALAVGLVLVLGDGPAPVMAMALLASGAGVEAMSGFARTSLRQAGIEQSLRRLSALSQSEKVALKYELSAPDAHDLVIGEHQVVPGERIALTGISGSGKTRLLEALAGLRQPVHALELDGKDISELSADQLRRQFALAPQDPMLLIGTIEDNLRVAAPSLSERQLSDALEIACLDERISAAPMGIATWLGAEGGFLSGGERKRLALARAILARRPWLLLDEPTEGLDALTEQRLISNLQKWLDETGTGLLLVSHRTAPMALTARSIPIETLETTEPS